jgi:hypothetical protein
MAFFLSIYRKAIFRYLMWPHSCIIPIAFTIIFCYCNVLRINFTQFCFFRICTFWNSCIHLIATLAALLMLKKRLTTYIPFRWADYHDYLLPVYFVGVKVFWFSYLLNWCIDGRLANNSLPKKI